MVAMILLPHGTRQGNLSYQHKRDKLQRLVVLDDAPPVSSSMRSDSWQAALKSGYRWRWQEHYRIEPYLGWRETGLQTGGFSDRGSAGFERQRR